MEKNMNKDEVLQKIRELHDDIKEHPYWRIFDHGMFRNEVRNLYNDLMDSISDLFYKTDYPETPFFCCWKTVFHDFRAMLSVIAYKPCEDTDNFKLYYLPVLQAYLQMAHILINGMDDDAEQISFYLTDNNSNPKYLINYIPEYKESWVDANGYTIHKENGWHSVSKIKENVVELYISNLDKVINAYKKRNDKRAQMYIDWYEACKRDLKNRTGFAYKVVK